MKESTKPPQTCFSALHEAVSLLCDPAEEQVARCQGLGNVAGLSNVPEQFRNEVDCRPHVTLLHLRDLQKPRIQGALQVFPIVPGT